MRPDIAVGDVPVAKPAGDDFPGPGTAGVFGFYSSLLTSGLTLLTFAIAVFTPPLSGPGCAGGCFQYPYTDIASRFPRDYIWMYPAMLFLIAFAAMMVAIHECAPRAKRVYSHLGVGLAMISVATLLIDYFVQVSVIQPSLLKNEHDSIAMLTQFNPHGLFIALEDFGYFMLSGALLCMAPVFAGKTKTEKALRWIFVGSFFLMVVSFAAISARYGINREYWFEIAAITIAFLALIISGVLLASLFRRELKHGVAAP